MFNHIIHMLSKIFKIQTIHFCNRQHIWPLSDDIFSNCVRRYAISKQISWNGFFFANKTSFQGCRRVRKSRGTGISCKEPQGYEMRRSSLVVTAPTRPPQLLVFWPILINIVIKKMARIGQKNGNCGGWVGAVTTNDDLLTLYPWVSLQEMKLNSWVLNICTPWFSDLPTPLKTKVQTVILRCCTPCTPVPTALIRREDNGFYVFHYATVKKWRMSRLSMTDSMYWWNAP